MPFWTYMLHCADQTFYVGHTDDLEKRVGEHEVGLIVGYTNLRRPVKLVWSEEFTTRDESRVVEKQLKGWGHTKKLALIRGDWAAISALAKGKKGPSTSSGKSGIGGAPRFLLPHFAHLPSEPFALEAIASWRGDRLALRYRLTGNLDLIRVPKRTESAREDGLWHHTCFEAFLRLDAGPAYVEFNLSPSHHWAVYRFDAHRAGMSQVAISTPHLGTKHDKYLLEVSADFVLPFAPSRLHLNLAAVIEEKSGHKSYWALAHPPEGPPDFHHPACFVLELPPRRQDSSPRT